jgi:hypothetical protein
MSAKPNKFIRLDKFLFLTEPAISSNSPTKTKEDFARKERNWIDRQMYLQDERDFYL